MNILIPVVQSVLVVLALSGAAMFVVACLACLDRIDREIRRRK